MLRSVISEAFQQSHKLKARVVNFQPPIPFRFPREENSI